MTWCNTCKALLGMVFTDGLSALYHASVVRERVPGEATKLADKHMRPFEDGSMLLTKRDVFDRLSLAASDFNQLDLEAVNKPRVGLVGEIYVKYNTFVNNNLIQWLMEQGMEVVLPPFLSFFHGSLVGFRAAVRSRIRSKAIAVVPGLGDPGIGAKIDLPGG